MLPPALILTLVLVTAGLTTGPVSGQSSSETDKRQSGFDFMGVSTQAMQKDDSLNPGMLWVKDGEALWLRPAGLSGKACVSCHGSAGDALNSSGTPLSRPHGVMQSIPGSMRGVAARYPAFDGLSKRPVSLNQRINQCRQQHQQTEPLRPESQELLSLESYVAHQSRGMALTPPEDARLEPFRQRGEQLFKQRMGQLNLSCAQCHDNNAGKRLGSSLIPQGHAAAYPAYRLEWQALGSLQRRLRNCMSGVRAEPFAYGAQELVELELYLAMRASGMMVETPAVRP